MPPSSTSPSQWRPKRSGGGSAANPWWIAIAANGLSPTCPAWRFMTEVGTSGPVCVHQPDSQGELGAASSPVVDGIQTDAHLTFSATASSIRTSTQSIRQLWDCRGP